MRTLLCAVALVSAASCGGARDAPDDPAEGSVARNTSADSAFADSVLRAAEDIGASITEATSANPAPLRDPDAIRLALRAYAGETYVGELFAARDSMNHRWPDRTRDPLRVWIQPSAADGFTESHRTIVRDAFDPWLATGIPVGFDFTDDSAHAEILVTWVDRYESRTTGRTRWVHDQHGWIIGAGIELALAQPDGRTLDSESLQAIARHEIGHLLGLDHTADEANIMSARVRVTELSEADRNTVRLVYKLPPGSVRAP
jgi:hypothetical protein